MKTRNNPLVPSSPRSGRIEGPLDHPYAGRPHRVYVALTNHCNRECPWCSTYSSPRGQTWITPDAFRRALPDDADFEVQLEGGEPTIHPQFWEFVAASRAHPRCRHVVLCTNGVALPRTRARLAAYLRRLGAPLTLKLSINHYLLERDAGLLNLARALVDAGGAERHVVLNVRLRRGEDDGVAQAVHDAGLAQHANIFDLQRYGLAADREDWELPHLAGHNFRLVNPDGAIFGPDLVGRADAMGRLP